MSETTKNVKQPSRRMSRKTGCLLSITLLILGLAAVEFGLRVFQNCRTYIVPDPVLHHVCRANARWWDDYRGDPYLLKINGQHWVEDYDVTREKPANVFRVFYVGDSNTQGVVPPAYRMVELVEQKLNREFADSGTKFELINAGTSSYGIIIYSLQIRSQLIKYSPDLVVINVDMTDVPNDLTYRQYAIWDDSGHIIAVPSPETRHERMRCIQTPHGHIDIESTNGLYEWLIDNSATFYYIERFRICYLLGRLERVPWAIQGDANWLAMEWSDTIEKNVEFSMGILRDLIQYLRDKGVKVMVTGVPHLPQYQGEWSDRPHEVLHQTVLASGGRYLDTYGEIKKRVAKEDIPKLYFSTDRTHFNRQGNAVWAKIQLDFLLRPENDLLPLNRLGRGTVK